MTLAMLKRWTCNPCGAESNQERPRGWTWLRSGGAIHHRCAECEERAAPEHKGVLLGKTAGAR